MNKNGITRCLTCGGDLVPNGKGIPTCEYCGRQYKDLGTGFSSELEEIVNRRQLREFIQAEELCRKLQQKQPENSEVYWQTLLSSLGVVYVQEEDKAKPTFFSYTYDDRNLIVDNENYKNAVKYAKSSEEIKYYETQAKELDVLLKAFFNLVAKEASYDIFISFKRTVTATVGGEERQIDTDDYYKAKEIYEHLSKKYKVFFSPVSIGQDTGIEGEKYEPRILKALQTSQAMILLGSRTEYLEAQWVQNEWKRYQYYMNKGKKSKSSLVLGYEKFMPALPVALKDIQLPSFDWYKANYLKELDSKLSFVKSSKGIKSTIRERKLNSNFEVDSNFDFGYTGDRITIGGKSDNNIVLSATEEMDLRFGESALEGKHFSDAKKQFDFILHKNPNNARAYWGRFKANIKADKDSAVPNVILANCKDEFFKDIDSAIDCSNNENFSWNIVDLLIKSIGLDSDWKKRKQVFEFVIKYLNDSRADKLLKSLFDIACGYIDKNVQTAMDVFDTSRKLFFEENKFKAMEYMRGFADGLYSKKYYDQARKYYEELASVLRDAEVYLCILGCRIKSLDVTQTKFKLDVNPDDDASIKKPSELDLDEIIERIIICNACSNNYNISETIKDIVLYQIAYNKKNAKPFIETVVSCYAQLNQEEKIIQFLMLVAERFIQLKDFKQAKTYYNEVLSHNPNYSKAHWGLLMCRLKVMDENQLIKKKSKLLNLQEYTNAISCANETEFAHYTAVYDGVIQEYNTSYTKNKNQKVKDPNKRAYLHFTKTKRMTRKCAIAMVCAILIALVTFTSWEINNPISYVREYNNTYQNEGYYIAQANMLFDKYYSDLEVNEYKGIPIIGVKNRAFKNKQLKTLKLAESVREIGDTAFNNCKNLESVVINGNNINIGNYAFADCISLSSISFGEGNKNARALNDSGVTIGNYAFKNTKLEKIEIPNVSAIGANAFENCANLKEIILEVEDSDIVDSKAFVGLPSDTIVYVPSISLDIYSAIAGANPNLSLKTYTLDAVKECEFFINRIGTITVDSEESILKAEKLYENLSPEQKEKVSNYSVLKSARPIYNVVVSIDNIGTVTLDSKTAILAAENVYNKLTLDEKSKVSNYAILHSARKVYDVMARINNIGTVTLDSDWRISTAESEYDKLAEEEKLQVSNYSVLTEARSKYRVLVVIDLIDKIGTVTLNSDTAITNAENAYSELATNEQSQVSNYPVLIEARSKYRVLVVIDLIKKIGTVTLNSDTAITNAENAYSALAANEQSQVSNYAILQSARKVFNVMDKIDKIGTITLDSDGVITEAENAYKELTANEKAQVKNYKKLIESRNCFNNIIKLRFELNNSGDGYVIFVADKSISGEVELPSQYNNKSVIGIGKDAFNGCNNLTKATIQNGLTSIGSGAFEGCSGLISVIIPNSVTSIGDYVFEGCSSLTSVTIPNSVTSIGENMFYNCSSLKSITIPSSIKSIKNKAFYGCSGLTSATIQNGVTSIGDSLFSGCSKLTSVTIPNSVTYIGSSVFSGCSSITSVTISNRVTCISADMFSGCRSLTSLSIPNSVTSIDASAFYECYSLASITIPSSVKSIGIAAFIRCGLTSITIPSSVKSIGHSAFSSCSNLASIKISDGVTSIGNSAFGGCSSLTSVTIPKSVTSIEYETFRGCSGLTSITIPNSVTSIGRHAFSGCSSLSSIIIPDSVTSIGTYAFNGCSKLTINCKASSQPSGWDSAWNPDNRPVKWGYRP